MTQVQVVFIDGALENSDSLAKSIASALEVHLLDATSDGLAQVAAILTGRNDLAALHFISHGAPGILALGSTRLDLASLDEHAASLAAIGAALAPGGDLLLYGCDIAAGSEGTAFVRALAASTGADVAASSDLTGTMIDGGNWRLEVDTGPIESPIPGNLLDAYAGTLGLGGGGGSTPANTAPTFGTADGIVVSRVGTSNAVLSGLALQPDGNIIAAGYAFNGNPWTDIAVVRYNPDGSLDPGFGNSGRAIISLSAGNDDGRGVMLQPDGKIVIAGITSPAVVNDFGLIRVDTSGNLDPTFGNGGKVGTDFTGAGSYDDARGAVLQTDGKIVVAGVNSSDANWNFAAARYNGDGSLDNSFDGDGKNTTDFGLGHDAANALALQANGKIVLAGFASNANDKDFALVRYNLDGSLDNTFDGDGRVLTQLGSVDDEASSVLIQPDQKILVAGASRNQLARLEITLVRYNPDGSLDSGFGNAGVVRVANDSISAPSKASALALQADGKILVAGTSNIDATPEFALIRLNTDGSMDTGFGIGGKVRTATGTLADTAAALLVQPDGRIVLGGSSYDTASNFALVRYNADGSLDASFDHNGTQSYVENGTPVPLAPDAHIFDKELAAGGHYNGATLTIARHGGANAQDVFTGSGTLAALVEGGDLRVGTNVIGSVLTNSGGTLVLRFGFGSTQLLVDSALRQIAYSNGAAAPPTEVRIDWTFSDMNQGFQGPGGTLSAVDGGTVRITPASGTFHFGALADGTIFSFDPALEDLVFDDPNLSASELRLQAAADGTQVSLSAAGKTIRFAADMLISALGPDNLQFADGSVLRVGDAAANTLTGTNGGDYLDGRGGADTLHGGWGDDTYVIDSAGDTVDESSPPAGAAALHIPTYTDTILASITLTLPDEIENLTLTGTSALDGSGNGLDNFITGNSAANALNGGTGNDTLAGGAGDDTLDGGPGSDTADYSDALEAVRVDLNQAGARFVSYRAGSDTLASIENLTGSGFADTLIGDAGPNRLQGLAGNDLLVGHAGNDTLEGGSGADTLRGGAGDDTYVVDDVGDVVDEQPLNNPTLVSVSSSGALADDYSFAPAFSVDGRYVVFESSATTLDGAGAPYSTGVYLHDLQTGSTQRISTNAAGGFGNGNSDGAAFSPDGHKVMFRSYASDLVAGDTNGAADIFVKDLTTGAIARVSTGAGDVEATGGAINGGSYGASFSGDGSLVVFASYATNLVGNDSGAALDIFVKDLTSGAVDRMSVTAAGVEGNFDSADASFSPDGRYVVFSSLASNLVADDTNSARDIFVKDRQTGALTRVSTDANGAQGDGDSTRAIFAPDGLHLLIESTAGNLVAGDTFNTPDIFRKNLFTGAIERVSTTAGNVPADNLSITASLSADGRYMAFSSLASNLVQGDTFSADVYVKDLATGAVRRASGNYLGNIIDGSSAYQARISADGSQIVFVTLGQLSSIDINNATDIYRVANPFLSQDGSDTVEASVTFTLPADVEHLLLAGGTAVDGSGNAQDNHISGNNAANTLTGAAGADSLDGAGGSDRLLGDAGDDVLTGGSDDDTLAGGSGNDSLAGDEGNDLLVPGAGNDTLAGGAGFDTADYSLAGPVRLSLAITGPQTVGGGMGADTLTDIENLRGSALADELTGNALANRIEGAAGNDSLDGGAGADTLVGGIGDDLYIVDDVGDIVLESATALPLRVSTTLTGEQTNGASFFPSLSGDGRLTGFSSYASNLVAGDTNNNADIFLKDLTTGAVQRLFINVDAQQFQINLFLDFRLAFSADNRFVAFITSVDTLVPGDTNGATDVFVLDRSDGSSRRASQDAASGQANADSLRPALSADGRYVAFQSYASNLVAGDTNGAVDIFVKDLQDGAISRVSSGPGGAQANAASGYPVLSGDGRLLAFSSYASNLVGDDTNQAYDIFVRDRQTGINTRISTDAAGMQANGHSFGEGLAFSADGRFLLFTTEATNLLPGSQLFSSSVMVKNLSTGAIARASESAQGLAGNGAAFAGAISADGHYVVFSSHASNLVDGDTNGASDIFVKDMWSGAIRRLSGNESGTEGNGESNSPTFSADSRHILFASAASNLVADDTNGGTDLFIIDNPFTRGANGFDTVQASVSYALGDSLENLRLTGLADTSGTGNTLDNEIIGNAAGNMLSGNPGDDTLDGGDGNDTLAGNQGSDRLLGGIGEDMLQGGKDNDRLEGGDGFDTLIGGDGNDVLSGMAQGDSLAGGNGDDFLGGGKGLDILDGGEGNDTLVGGLGSDTLIGGNGIDTADYSGSAEALAIDLNLVGAQVVSLLQATESLSGIENLLGGAFGDLITGNALNNLLAGNAANDTLAGGDGFDTLEGGDGDDILSGMNQGDVINGGNGNDFLGGGKGLDILDGGSGDDTLQGGLGTDVLTGGNGLDQFVFSTALDGVINVDTIIDFTSGTDRIQLSAAVFTAFAAQVGQAVGLGSNLTYNASTGVLAYDADGMGSGAALNFAILGSSSHPASLGADFLIIA